MMRSALTQLGQWAGLSSLLAWAISAPVSARRSIVLAVDSLTAFACLCVSSAVTFPMFDGLAPTGLLAATVAATGSFAVIGTHRIKLSAYGVHDMQRAAAAGCTLAASSFVVSYLLDLSVSAGIAGLSFIALHVAGRFAGRECLRRHLYGGVGRMPVAIFGAGAAGIQLLASLRQDPSMRPVTFVDDNPALHKMTVSGLKVRSRAGLQEMVRRNRIQRVLLAIPSASDVAQRRLAKDLSAMGCEVHALPSYPELIDVEGLAANLRLVTADLLLGRDKIDLQTPEMARAYAGRRVLITGAGGSIGSELSRQILLGQPERLTLLDHSEYALYTITRELKPLADAAGIELVSRLGSVCDRERMDHVIAESEIDIILFAAAYKHVPLVEDNEIEGLRNNLFGTIVTAEAARDAQVERFILASTDKAVRPANIMGASKRLAELALQDLQTRSDTTKFAMVRFGNVLGSSGSVIPLFQEQIAAGGPITLTHNEISRYFMTISEASRLVLLAGAFARGGDVFVLDMGDPVNIGDLAYRMVELSGLTVRDSANPRGDIEVEVVGLRPGEKMCEELFIGKDIMPTPHAKIWRAEEACLSELEMARVMKQIRSAVSAQDAAGLRNVLADCLDGFGPAPTAVMEQAL